MDEYNEVGWSNKCQTCVATVLPMIDLMQTNEFLSTCPKHDLTPNTSRLFQNMPLLVQNLMRVQNHGQPKMIAAALLTCIEKIWPPPPGFYLLLFGLIGLSNAALLSGENLWSQVW